VQLAHRQRPALRAPLLRQLHADRRIDREPLGPHGGIEDLPDDLIGPGNGAWRVAEGIHVGDPLLDIQVVDVVKAGLTKCAGYVPTDVVEVALPR
jgi:hypothetical protein